VRQLITMERVDSADSVSVESDSWEDCDRTDSSRGEDNLQEAKTAIYVETVNSQVRVASGEQKVSWSAQNPSHVSAVKSRSPWSLKRTHKRIDGLRHLCKCDRIAPDCLRWEKLAKLICFQALASVVDGNLQKQIQPLHGIVFCLVRLDLWTLMAAIKVSDGSSHNLHPNEYEDIEELLPEYETSTWFGKEYYAGLHPQEEAIMKYVQGFSKVQAIRRIQDVKTLPYLPRMLDVEITTYQVAKAAREFAESSPKFALPQKAKKTGGKIGKADYIELCVRKSREARYLLQAVYRIALELRGHIAKAFSEALLDDISLDSLQAKMSALQEHFTEVSIELGKPPQDLIWGSPSWWYVAIKKNVLNVEEKLIEPGNDHKPKSQTANSSTVNQST
jgi:hypothetical protein